MNNLVLIINVGSTSVKTRLFDVRLHTQALLDASYDSSMGFIVEGVDTDGKTYRHDKPCHDINGALLVILALWRQMIAEHGWSLVAIGHRIVHGGIGFNTVTALSQEVMQRIAELDAYAPLHNPLNRLGAAMAAEVFPGIAQYAVFDTAFHRSIPDYAGRYAIPENLCADLAFYRYGFHGISCQHSVAMAAKLLAASPSDLNLIVLHLGGGASATAIRAGVSVDTSMGFSPTEGLLMATRSGDLDPMITVTLQKQGWSLTQIERLLNHESGLLGICGAADMRLVVQKAEQGEAAAQLALDMFCYRARKYIGAYCAVLGNVDALVFTGGIGEHAPLVRDKILQGLGGLGFVVDHETNWLQTNQLQANNQRDIGDRNNHSRILVIHAEEEREIARQIFAGLGFPGVTA